MLSKFFDRPIALKFSSHEIIGKRGGLNLELVWAYLWAVFNNLWKSGSNFNQIKLIDRLHWNFLVTISLGRGGLEFRAGSGLSMSSFQHSLKIWIKFKSNQVDWPIALKFPSHDITGKRRGSNLELVWAIFAWIFRKRTPLNYLKFYSSEKLTLKLSKFCRTSILETIWLPVPNFISWNYAKLKLPIQSATLWAGNSRPSLGDWSN